MRPAWNDDCNTGAIMQCHWIVSASLLASGCGGLVIIEDGASGQGGTVEVDVDDPQQEVTPPEDDSDPQETSDGWGAIPDGPCSSCGQWYDACGDGDLCPHPNAVCGGELAQAKSMIACVCAGCTDACGGNCVLFDQSQDPTCRQCQQLVIQEPCQYERLACTGLP
jgi:hypothetical protein